MIQLDGFDLPPGMVWQDRYAWSPVVQSVRRTIGGSVIINTAVSTSRPMTLIALADQGWLLKPQVDYLQTLAAVEGGVYSLTVGSETFSVMFRHQEAPAVEVSPLIPRGVPLEDDYFIGVLKFMTV